MKTALQKIRLPAAAGALALLVVGGALHAAPATPADSAAADSRTALACATPSNCVNSLGSSDLKPLHFAGTPAQAVAALRATLAKFHEAKILKTDTLSMEVVFTTAVGFQDLVDFRIDADAQRIDYRSRSKMGKYDFGKNHSRMSAFSTRFEQTTKRAPVTSP